MVPETNKAQVENKIALGDTEKISKYFFPLLINAQPYLLLTCPDHCPYSQILMLSMGACSPTQQCKKEGRLDKML